MNNPAVRAGFALTAALAVVLLVACEDRTIQQTAGQKLDKAIARTGQAASEVKVKTQDLAQKARAQVDASATRAEPVLRQSAAQARDALKGAGVTVAAALDDTAITTAVTSGLTQDSGLSAVKIDVHTEGGTVTLRGPAPDTAAKARAGDIAKAVRGVTSVNNLLSVAG